MGGEEGRTGTSSTPTQEVAGIRWKGEPPTNVKIGSEEEEEAFFLEPAEEGAEEEDDDEEGSSNNLKTRQYALSPVQPNSMFVKCISPTHSVGSELPELLESQATKQSSSLDITLRLKKKV